MSTHDLLKFAYDLSPLSSVETIRFYHKRDDTQLKAMIWKPRGNGPFPLIAFDVGLQFRIWDIPMSAKLMARAGFAVLGTAYKRIEIAKGEVKDIVNAIDYAHANFPFLDGRTVLVGISMGGATMLNIASKFGRSRNVVAVVAMAPFSDLTRAFYYTQGYILANYRTNPRVRLLRLYQKHAFTRPADEPKEFYVRSPINFVEKIECPVLLIHGKNDEIVSFDHSAELYSRMKELRLNVKLEIVPGEGIHTPLKASSMLRKFNFIGFSKTWFTVHKFLRKILSEKK